MKRIAESKPNVLLLESKKKEAEKGKAFSDDRVKSRRKRTIWGREDIMAMLWFWLALRATHWIARQH